MLCLKHGNWRDRDKMRNKSQTETELQIKKGTKFN